MLSSMTATKVSFGTHVDHEIPAYPDYDGKTRRLPSRRSRLRPTVGLQWQDDADWSNQWARRCIMAEASAIRSAADLRFDIIDEVESLGCFWPVVWSDDSAHIFMGDEWEREELYPYGKFGGYSWDEDIPKEVALERFSQAVNLLHMDDVPIEMEGKRPEYFVRQRRVHGVCRGAFAQTSFQALAHGYWMWVRPGRTTRRSRPKLYS